MINNEEQIETNKEDHNEIIQNNCENDYLIKKNLIKFLEMQIKEYEKKILEKINISEKEITAIYIRTKKEIENTRKFSLETLIKDFLPIADNIERAIDLIIKNSLQENCDKILKKLEDTYNLLKKSFDLFHIKKINDIHVLFNPSIHQAMSIQKTDELESNHVLAVMQSGYLLHESRLLRPAMVVVSTKKI